MWLRAGVSGYFPPARSGQTRVLINSQFHSHNENYAHLVPSTACNSSCPLAAHFLRRKGKILCLQGLGQVFLSKPSSGYSLSITPSLSQTSYNFTKMPTFYLPPLLPSKLSLPHRVLLSLHSFICSLTYISFHASIQTCPGYQRHRRHNGTCNSHGPALAKLGCSQPSHQKSTRWLSIKA